MNGPFASSVAKPGESPKLLRQQLARWFRAQGRDLPWRGTRDPYAIMVSE